MCKFPVFRAFFRVLTIAFVVLVGGVSRPVQAAVHQPNALPADLQNVGIKEKLGERVPVESLQFRDETGAPVTLSKYFHSHKPVIVNLVYFACPGLCNFVLNGMIASLRGFEWLPGNEFEIVTVSIDPKEGPDLAFEKKKNYLKNLGRLDAEKGWHFLTGDQANIQKLADAVGFGFKWVPEQKEFAHGSGIFVLTPDAYISRILYGIEYQRKDLKLSLLEASNGKIGSIVDRVLLFCYRYDPDARGYSLFAVNLMKAGGVVTMLSIAGFVFWFLRRERKHMAKETS